VFTRVCWLVGWFVRSVVRSLVIRSLRVLGKHKSDFHEIWQRCSAPLLNFITNFGEVEVKVQGQSRAAIYTDSIAIVTARQWFKISLPARQK